MAKIHADIRITGIVQGVGFRPFVHRLVTSFSLCGEVKNTSFGASLSLEGEKEKIFGMVSEIEKNPPPLAYIENIEISFSEKLSGYVGFEISESERGDFRRTLISPDVATCPDCLREMYDKDNRRYRYPFINCTNCGPRFTITRDIPYDRKNTTMSGFHLCDLCRGEYTDIENRRYHAEPVCCEDCGPKLFFLDEKGRKVSGDAISIAREKPIP